MGITDRIEVGTDGNLYTLSVSNGREYSSNRVPEFEILGKYIVRNTPMPEIDDCTYKTEAVMDKQTFVEAYNKWIVEAGGEDGNDD